jgi:predicted deacylase
MNETLPPIEIKPRDLQAYRAGNTGVPYVHRFDSGRPGPHVLINALTHGNEFCGMVAACHLLDSGVRPHIGTLTVSFANVAAYESFDAARPFESRQITHNLNRIWSTAWLDGAEDSIELRRARELRGVVAAADHILDIHSTSHPVQPFFVYPNWSRNAQAAMALSQPAVHLVMPQGMGTGTPLIQHGLHGTPDHHGVALVVECGQHFEHRSGQRATAAALEFLAHFGLLDKNGGEAATATEPKRRFELLKTFVVQTEDFRFVRPLLGFESFDEGELIATDGEQEIRALCADCTVFMPARRAIVGREAVYLTRPMA